MGREVRLWGPPTGESVGTWKGAIRAPACVAGPLLLRLNGMRAAGEIGRFHVGRTGKGYAVWIGQRPKEQRPACGARTRRGTPCRARAVPGKDRCRMHGGLSSGPKTAEGRARIAESNRRRAGRSSPP